MAVEANVKKAGFRMPSLSDRAYFFLCAALFAAIMIVFALVVCAEGAVWDKYDTGIFYKMADVIVSGGTPYVDFADPKPPLIFFTLAVPAMLGEKLLGGALLVGICNLVSAVAIMSIAWRLYGRLPGLLAGLIFSLNLVWIEGIFILTEPFALAFMMLSTWALLFHKGKGKYLLAGACAGIAIGYKQYALLLLPLSLLYLYLKAELAGAAWFVAGALAALVAIFGAVFIVYGMAAGASALYWSFGVADAYVTTDMVGGVPAWKPVGTFATVSNIVYVTIAIVPLMIFALASYAIKRRTIPEHYFFISGLAFFATILIRPYFHYLVLALPFIALLCARAFGNDRPGADSAKYK